ncbi:hypothetical protein [Streptomyces sp. NPDC056948]|uniref:hypothetical protein n=1 Tax=Streptomyces sp. NPDC056948 TaxID=3345975 RepID=UPI003625236D
MAARHRTRCRTAGAALALALAAVLTGCNGGYDSPSDTASKAESAVESATAEAQRRLDDIQDGVDVKGDVKAGPTTVGSDGRARTEVTVNNTDDAARSFAVQVNFTDSGNQLIDTVIVTVNQVQPNHTATATARSTHDLSGKVQSDIARAVRY